MFKDVIAASLRNDDPELRARMRALFPDNRAPSPEELEALKTFACENRRLSMFPAVDQYHLWYTFRVAQFRNILQHARDNDDDLSEED